jgi:DNA-binding IclR family transcriptional regulator
MSAERRVATLNRARLANPVLFESMSERIDQARKSLATKGYCLSEGETQAGLVAIATPMRIASHEEPIAFNCAVPAYQLRKGQLEKDIAPKLIAMVRMLENQTGAR